MGLIHGLITKNLDTTTCSRKYLNSQAIIDFVSFKALPALGTEMTAELIHRYIFIIAP